MTSTAEVGNLRVSLFADTAQFAAGLALAQSSLGKFGETAKQFSDKVLEFFAFDHIRDTIAETVHQMDELGKTAQKIGIPVDQLSKLEYAAKLSDVSVEDLTTSLTKFSKGIAQIAAGGQNEAAQALRAIGVSAIDARGKLIPTSTLIEEIAAKFSVMKDSAAKTALAIALFGKSGASMIPLLNGGREAIRAAGSELEQFGGVVTPEAAKRAEEFNDSLTRLQTAFNSLLQEALIPILPTLTELTQDLIDLFKQGSEFGKFISDANGWLEVWGPSLTNTKREIEGISDALRTLGIIGKKPLEIDIPGGDLAPPAPNQTKDAPTITSLADMQKHLAELKKAAEEADRNIAKLFDEGKSLTAQFDPIAKYQDDLSHLNEVYNSGAISSATYQKALAQLREQFAQTVPQVDQFAEAFVSLSENFATTFGDAFAGVISGTESLKQAFASMAQSISQQLAQLAAQLAASAFIKLLGIVLGGGTSPSQSTWVNNLGSLFGGGKASGGPVSAGTTYLVGENGPELFTPGMSGGITPNSKMGGGGINVTVINNSSASVNAKKGADGSLKVFVEETMADLVLRGGNKVDAALARGYNLRRAGR